MITLILCLMYGVAAWFFTLWAKEIIKSNHPELGIPDNVKGITSLVFGIFFPIFLVVGAFRIWGKK